MIYSFNIGFLDIRWIDMLDIALVSVLLYQVYKLLKGSVAGRTGKLLKVTMDNHLPSKVEVKVLFDDNSAPYNRGTALQAGIKEVMTVPD